MHAKFAELSAARSGGTRFKIEGWHGGFDRVPHMPAAASSKAPTGEHLGFSIFHRFQIPKLLIYVGHAKNKRPPKICSGQLISDTAIGFLAAMFRSKTAGGRLPNTELIR